MMSTDVKIVPWSPPYGDVVDVAAEKVASIEGTPIGGVDFGSAIASAVASAGHSETMKELSPMAGALATAVDTGLGSAMGLSTSLSQAGAEAAQEVASSLAETVGSSVADVVGNVVEAVPILGAFIKAAISLVELGSQGWPPGENPSQECQQLFSNFPPQKSGSMLAGGQSVPADFFANVNPLAQFWLGPAAEPSKLAALQKDIASKHLSWYAVAGFMFGSAFDDTVRPSVTSSLVDPAMPPTVPFYLSGPLKCRSTIGMALMQITEGQAIDLDDIDWNQMLTSVRKINDENRKGAGKEQFKDAKQVRTMWEAAVERDAKILVEGWRKVHPQDKAGLPKAWRERFKTLRRGIEGSYWPNTKTPTDGGVALWITYIDLFAQAYAKGYLNDGFVEFIFGRQTLSMPHWQPGMGDLFFNQADSAHAVVWKNLWLTLNARLLGTAAVADKDYVAGNTSAAPFTWIWFQDPCPRNATFQVRQLVESWGNTTRPHYTMGKAKVAEILSQAKAAAVGKKVVQKPPPPAHPQQAHPQVRKK
jgi:hypothetical protein